MSTARYLPRHSKPYSEAAETDVHRPYHKPTHRRPTLGETLGVLGRALSVAFGKTRDAR